MLEAWALVLRSGGGCCVCGSEWGTELRRIGEGFMWHDDIAQNLGGYEPVAAVSESRGHEHDWRRNRDGAMPCLDLTALGVP